jgi:hypothetical protein
MGANRMPPPQIRFRSFLLLSAGLPIWLFLVVAVPSSTGFPGGFRFLAAPLVLSGIAVASRSLLPDHPDAWAISICSAGIIALGALSITSWLAG